MTARLSPRQAILLRLAADGWSNKRIGRHEGTTEAAVGTELYRAYRILGAANRAHAVAIGFRTGVIR